MAVWRRMGIVVAAALAAVVAIFPFWGDAQGQVIAVAASGGGELLSRANVVVDGKQTCSGHHCRFDLATGVHEIAVRAEGYLPQLQVVAVRPHEATAINFRLERVGAWLHVSGYPEGASLVVDGQWMGRLPLHLELAPGAHRLRVEADRFLSEERAVELVRGETKRINDIALLPRMGRLAIDVRTPGAEVTLVSGSELREHLDVSRPIDIDLSRQWTLEVTKDGYRMLREPLSWNGSSEKTFVVALEKAASSGRR